MDRERQRKREREGGNEPGCVCRGPGGSFCSLEAALGRLRTALSSHLAAPGPCGGGGGGVELMESSGTSLLTLNPEGLRVDEE